MLYFAYGSNMCTRRLTKRVPSACARFVAQLAEHAFRFHKRSTDGSGKADAYETGNPNDQVWGVVFDIDPTEKPCLDDAEGLGHGYIEKQVTVIDSAGHKHPAYAYVAEPNHINAGLQPYSWYKRFVVEGAKQHNLPDDYVTQISSMPDVDDTNRQRDAQKRAIPC